MKLANSDTLYIRLSKNEFIFARYDHLKSQTINFVCYKVKPDISLNANMHQALQSMSLTKGDFNFVRILVDSPATLVPLNEFDEDNYKELYFFNLPEKQKRRVVYYDTLPHLGAVLLFSIDKDICHTIKETFPNLLFQSAETPQLLHFASCGSPAQSGDRFFVSLYSDRMTIVSFQNGKIGLYNTFKLHTPEDAIYYTLHAVRLWGLNPDSDEVYIGGEREPAEVLQQAIFRYLPHSSVLKAEEEFNAQVLALQKALPYDLITFLLRAY